MLTLKHTLKLDQATIAASDLTECFGSDDLVAIGERVWEQYERDRASRADWERRTEAAMDLAMQVQEEKSFPWPGCSNVAFPLVTIAAMQFHARAYPAVVNGRSVVQCRVIGDDPQGVENARAERIGRHMSWQLLEQDEGWEAGMDKALLVVPIMGCAFKKSYYDTGKGHNVSELVLPQNLIVDYYATSIESAATKTHYIPASRNELLEKMRSGVFKDYSEEEWMLAPPPLPSQTDAQRQADNRTGMEPPQPDDSTPYITLEQHTRLDMDGDGMEEPYIVTIEESTHKVLRIVCRFDRGEDIDRNPRGQIIRIRATEYFTKLPFIPSPDGGIYDLGFGTLLGPLNESVNTGINQLFDAGTMANTAGGFLARGAKIRGGEYNFSPFAWNRVDSTGEDLSKSIYPLPVREPSATLFNLLSLLIEYANRIVGSTDMMVGENPGQNTPAETSRAMIEQGMKIYSAIFKRLWRAMKGEFKKLYQLNSVYLPQTQRFGAGPRDLAMREDYAGSGNSVVPVADPTITSEGARYAQAVLVREASLSRPGYDGDAVERRFLRALGVDEVDMLFPGAAGMEPQEDPKVVVERMKLEYKYAELELKKMEFVSNAQMQMRVNDAKIMELNAKAMKIAQEARTEENYAMAALINTQIAAIRADNDQMNKQIELALKAEEVRNEARSAAADRKASKSTAKSGN
jgi:chaperonin GroES